MKHRLKEGSTSSVFENSNYILNESFKVGEIVLEVGNNLLLMKNRKYTNKLKFNRLYEKRNVCIIFSTK